MPAAVLLALVAALFPALGCRRTSAPPRAAGVVVISVDTLRADRLGAYGRQPSITPYLDSLGNDAVVFRCAIAQAPSTLASHASLFTSAIPQHHGASFARQAALAPDRLTLAETLRANGFKTVAFHGGGQLDARFGVGRGFDRYQVETGAFAVAVDKALGWLERRRRPRFFMFLHTYEAHHPYIPSPEDLAALDSGYRGPLPAEISIELLAAINANRQTPITAADLRHIEQAYDSGVRSVDRAFGAFIEGLKRLGLYDSTLVVFTSDHGEEFGEHGKVGMHGHTLYDELLHVPLLVKYPRSWHAGAVLKAQVRTIDIAPTVLGVLGLPVPAAFEGSDLTRYAASGPPPPPYAVSAIDGGGSSLRSLRWKWDRGALFDLQNDPAESFNVVGRHAQVADQLQHIQQELVAESAARSAGPVMIDPSLEERLKALGYIE